MPSYMYNAIGWTKRIFFVLALALGKAVGEMLPDGLVTCWSPLSGFGQTQDHTDLL